MIFRFEVDTSNAAYDGSMADVAEELRRQVRVATDLMIWNGLKEGRVMDINGNTVGRWTYQ
jgi:hypothetical protein